MLVEWCYVFERYKWVGLAPRVVGPCACEGPVEVRLCGVSIGSYDGIATHVATSSTVYCSSVSFEVPDDGWVFCFSCVSITRVIGGSFACEVGTTRVYCQVTYGTGSIAVFGWRVFSSLYHLWRQQLFVWFLVSCPIRECHLLSILVSLCGWWTHPGLWCYYPPYERALWYNEVYHLPGPRRGCRGSHRWDRA